jgi:eukaryotic translation initiation factor 2C
MLQDTTLPQKPINLRKFNIRLKMASLLDMTKVQDFIHGRLLEAPTEALQALDVLMRHRPSMLLATVGRSFFTRNDAKLLGDGAECWMGFHQSLRPARGKLLVNIDVSATAFYEPGTSVRLCILFPLFVVYWDTV